jgi:hypothetical protein
MATSRFSLWDFLGAIPDPRVSFGCRFSLQSILDIIIAGTLAGRNSIRSIARWANALEEEDFNDEEKAALADLLRSDVDITLEQFHFEIALAA